MTSDGSISTLEIEQERKVGFIYALSGPVHSKILLHANKRYTKWVPYLSKMVSYRVVRIFAGVYYYGLAIFCPSILRELIFAIGHLH